LSTSSSGTAAAFGAGAPFDFTSAFLEALLGFYHAKLSRPSTQSALFHSPLLLRHTLDELVSFEAKLEALYAYPVHSSRRLSLLDALLLPPHAFEAVLKQERDAVNDSLDALRDIKRPWEFVVARGKTATSTASSSTDTADLSDDEDEDETGGILSAATDAEQQQLLDESALDDPSSSSSSLLPSASFATHSALHFLRLVGRVTRRYRSFKFLNHRLALLKGLQFKLFEIYEEDLLRAYQTNWKRLAANARAGGIKYLMLERDSGSTAENKKQKTGPTTPAARLNPVRFWSTHCGLLNTLSYIAQVLQTWNDEVVFLELFYFYTHQARIQTTFLAVHHEAHEIAKQTGDETVLQRVPGVLVQHHLASSASSASAASAGGGDEKKEEKEEVLITSEELALWMAQGGQIHLTSPLSQNSEATAAATAASARAAASVPRPGRARAAPGAPSA